MPIKSVTQPAATRWNYHSSTYFIASRRVKNSELTITNSATEMLLMTKLMLKVNLHSVEKSEWFFSTEQH